ncbi:MAG: serine hydrolase domain-containing protein [Bacteroidota bacterium]
MKKYKNLISAISLIAGLLMHINIHAQKSIPISRAELSAQIKAYVEQEMSQRKIVGLSVAVVDTEGVLLSDGFGFADKGKNILADKETIFPIASITKTFTGIAIMQLVEQGLIELDKPIGGYINELSLPSGEERVITTRMLLTHHSGLHGDILYHWYLPAVSKNPLVHEQIVDLINETGTIFTPGKLHSYCNVGYSLLGILIHKVSGEPYVDYIRSHILSPLGMDHTIVFAGENTDEVIAKGYDGKTSMDMPMILGIPAGGMAISSDDAARYMRAIIHSYYGEGTLLKAQSMKQMMTQQNGEVPIDRGFSIGFTWFLQHPIGEYTKYASHRGESPPYHAMLAILPEIRTGVFISTNTNKAAEAPDEMVHKIIEDLYEYHSGNTISKGRKSERLTIDREQVKQYEGIYQNVYFGPMEVKVRKRKLVIKSSAIPIPLTLAPYTKTTYSVKAQLFGVIPISNKTLDALRVEFREIDGEKFLFFHIQNSIINPNLRIEPYEIPPAYKNYIGKYNVTNMENSDRVAKRVRIKKSRHFYVLQYTFLGRHKFNLAIRPVDNQNARLAGIGPFMGEKIGWETSGDKLIMRWSGLVLEKE